MMQIIVVQRIWRTKDCKLYIFIIFFHSINLYKYILGNSRCPTNKINSLIVPSELDGALLRSVTVAPDAGLVNVVPEVILFLFT